MKKVKNVRVLIGLDWFGAIKDDGVNTGYYLYLLEGPMRDRVVHQGETMIYVNAYTFDNLLKEFTVKEYPGEPEAMNGATL